MNKGIAARWMMLFLLLFSPLMMVMTAPFAFAAQGPQTFTLDGRIKQAGTTTPILDPSVKIEVHVMNPSRTCVIYAEEQFVNTQTSNGYFNIQVGSNIGAGKRIAGVDPGLSMATVFQNTTPMTGTNVAGQTCPAGTYTPLARDSRYFRIFVTPSLAPVTDQLDDIVLDAVPTAMVAETADKVGNFGPADLLRVNTVGVQILSQANLENIFTSSNYAVLTSLLAGTSNLYNKPAANGTTVLPTIAAPTSPSAGQIWYNAGNVYFHDGAVTRTISTGSSTSVSAADGSAAAPTISFASDTNTGWYLAAPDNLAAATGGVERVRINENGNLGVGSSAPGARLTLGGNMSAPAWLFGGIGIRQNSATYNDTTSSGATSQNYINAFGIPTLTATSATTYSNASAFSLYPPVPGTNVTLTSSTGLTINSTSLAGGGGTTNGYGLQVNAPTGAANNYAATFMGGNVGIGTTAPQTKLVINANAAAPQAPNSGSHLQVSGSDNSGSSITLDAYGTNFYDSPYFTMRKAQGTAASPGSTLINDILGDVQMQGYFSGFDNGAEIVGVASENWSGTAKGTKVQISAVRRGTTSRVVSTFGDYGLAVGSSNPAASSLEINGSYSVPSWTTTGQNFAVKAATSTDTTGSGAIATRVSSSFAAPTFASSSAVTVGDAATVYIAGAPIQGANTTITRSNSLYVAAGQSYFGGNVGVGVTAPTASLHLKAGTAAAGTAPLKLTAGPVNTTAEAGAIEFDGTSLFYTDSTNTRRTLGVSGAGITALTGDVTASGAGSVVATIPNDTVTFAKMQNIATQRLLGRSTAAAGDVEELTVGTGLTITGGALNLTDTTDDDSFAALVCGNGFVPYKSGGVWTCLEARSDLVNDTLVLRGATGSFEGNQVTANSLRLNNAGAYVSINTPAAANYTLTLPADDGTTSGQVLTTNGSGVLSWSTITPGTGDFLANGTVPMTGQFDAASGTIGAPGISFAADQDTGLSTDGSNGLQFSSGGVLMATLSSVGIIMQNSGVWGSSTPGGAYIRSGAGSAAQPTYSFSADDDNGMFRVTTDTVGFSTAGSERMRIDSTGNVGIGSSAPGARLTLGGDMSAASWQAGGIGIRQNSANYTDTTSSGTVGFNYVNAFGVPTLLASSATTYNNASSFSMYPPVPGANVTLTNSTALTINSTSLVGGGGVTNGYGLQVNAPTGATNNYAAAFMGGNVGIGTTAPTASLHLKAGTTAAGTAPLKLTAGPVNTTAEAGAIEFDGTSLFYTDSTNTRRTLGVAGAGITALTGDVTASGAGSVVATIPNDTVTFAKMQNIATQRLLGRSTAAAGDVEELTVGTGLTITGGALNLTDTTDDDSFAALVCGNGFVPYKSGGVWTCLEARSDLVNDTLVLRGATGSFEGNQVTANSLRLNNAGSYVSISTPAAANYTLTLPADDGTTSGQVLTTNGSGVLTWTTPVASGGTGLFADGTAAAPSISFTSDQDTGIYRVGANELGFAANGSMVANMTTTTFGLNGIGMAKLQNGIGAGAPTYSFLNDENTGIYNAGADIVGFSTNATERMRINNSGNVGIGTTAPDTKLMVDGTIRVGDGGETCAGGNFTGGIRYNGGNLQFCNGVSWSTLGTGSGSGDFLANGTVPMTGAFRSIAGTAALPGVTFVGDTNTGVYAPAADVMAVTTAGTERMRVDATGLVGVGTTAPLSRFSVTPVLDATLPSEENAITFTPGNDISGFTHTALGYYENGAGPVSYIQAHYSGYNAPFAINPYAGPVGVGTFSPATKLDVAGSIKVGNGGETCGATYAGAIRYNAGNLQFCNGTAWTTLGTGSGSGDFLANGTIPMTGAFRGIAGTAALPGITFVGDTNTGLSAATADSLVLSTAGTARLTADASGNIGIGTTAPSSSLHVHVPSGANAMVQYSDGDVAHGMTTVVPTEVFGRTSPISGTKGGFSLEGYNDDGTDSGLQLLGVLGSATPTATVPAIRIRADKKNGTGIQALAANETLLQVQNGGTPNVTILGSGNVGIGTTVPDTKLHVSGTIRVGDGGETCAGGNFTGGIRYNGGNLQFCDGTAWTTLGTGSGSGDFLANGTIPMTGPLQASTGSAAAPSITFDGDEDTGFYNYTANGISLATGGTERIRFGNDGSITAQTAYYLLGSSNTAASPTFSFAADTNTGMFPAAADELGFTTNGTEKMRILASGNVGIGSTNPSSRLQVSSTNSANNDATTTSSALIASPTVAQASSRQNIGLYASSTAAGSNNVGKLIGIKTYVDNWNHNSTATVNEITGADLESYNSSGNVTLVRGIKVSAQSSPAGGYSTTTVTGAEITATNQGSAATTQHGAKISTVANAAITTNYGLYLDHTGAGVVTNNYGIFQNSSSQKNYFAGNVGIGTSAPSVKLDVTGTLKIGNGAELCPAVGAGGLRYNSGALEVCDGATWTALGGGGGSGDFLANGTVPMTGAFRSIAGTAGAPGMAFVGDTNNGLFAPAADNVAITTDGAERMRVTATGNVGIGTTDPQAEFHIHSPTPVSMNPSILLSHANVSHGMTSVAPDNVAARLTAYSALRGGASLQGYNDDGAGYGVMVYGALGSATPTVTVPAILMRGVKKNGTGAQALGATESVFQVENLSTPVITVKGSGNVGIGATAPDATLDVKGNFAISGSTSGAVKFAVPAAAGSATYTWPAAAPGSNMVLQSDNTGTLSWVSAGGGGLTNFTESVNTAAPNATIPAVRLIATNAASSVDMVISPKSNGALITAIPDGIASGGNKRGTRAVDLQLDRTVNTMVASGMWSTISGGAYNTASGDLSVVSGGRYNRALGNQSSVPGGESVTATGARSIASGDVTTADAYAQATFGAYNMPKGSETAGSWVSTDPIFVVGNGTGSGASRSTAVMVLKNGNVGFGTTAPDTKLQVAGTVRVGDGGETCSGGNYTGGIRYNGGNLQFCNGTAWTTLGAGGGSGDFMADGSVPMTGTIKNTLGSASLPSYTFSGETDNGMYLPAADILGFSTAGAERMRIDSLGRVGIGTTAPNARLHIIDNQTIQASSSSAALSVVTSGGAYRAQLGYVVGTNSGLLELRDSTNTATTSIKGIGDSFLSTGAAGNVGIGTTAPDTKLHVAGTVRVGDGGETCSGGNFTGGIRYNGGNLQFCNGTAWTTLGTGGGGGLPAADGSAAAPTINFTNSATTGFYRASAGVIGVSAAGNSVATISATTFNAGGLDFSSNSVTTNAVTSNGTVVAAGNIISTGGRMVAGVSTDADALSAITVTFANSNMVRVTTSPAAACGTLNVTNTTAGGSFTVTILNANATCSTINWNGAPTNVKLPTGYAGGVAANGLVYTFIDDGATLWVSYVPF